MRSLQQQQQQAGLHTHTLLTSTSASRLLQPLLHPISSHMHSPCCRLQVAWDDGHEALRRRLPTGLSLEDTVSLTFTGSLPIVGSRNISMELRPSRDLPDADTHLAVLNAPPAIPESVEGEVAAGDGLSAIPSTFTVRPTSPQAASSPFAVMAGLAPFAGARMSKKYFATSTADVNKAERVLAGGSLLLGSRCERWPHCHITEA